MQAILSRNVIEDYLSDANESMRIRFFLVNQCAPVMKHLKPAQMLTLSKECVKEMASLCQTWDLCYLNLYQDTRKEVILIYREAEMLRFLGREKVLHLLEEKNYDISSFSTMIHSLCEKMESFYKGVGKYPHEVGLFLGYPLEDVLGFMGEKQVKPLYRGYWVVYNDLNHAKNVFKKYDQARRELLLRLLIDHHKTI